MPHDNPLAAKHEELDRVERELVSAVRARQEIEASPCVYGTNAFSQRHALMVDIERLTKRRRELRAELELPHPEGGSPLRNLKDLNELTDFIDQASK